METYLLFHRLVSDILCIRSQYRRQKDFHSSDYIRDDFKNYVLFYENDNEACWNSDVKNIPELEKIASYYEDYKDLIDMKDRGVIYDGINYPVETYTKWVSPNPLLI